MKQLYSNQVELSNTMESLGAVKRTCASLQVWPYFTDRCLQVLDGGTSDSVGGCAWACRCAGRVH